VTLLPIVDNIQWDMNDKHAHQSFKENSLQRTFECSGCLHLNCKNYETLYFMLPIMMTTARLFCQRATIGSRFGASVHQRVPQLYCATLTTRPHHPYHSSLRITASAQSHETDASNWGKALTKSLVVGCALLGMGLLANTQPALAESRQQVSQVWGPSDASSMYRSTFLENKETLPNPRDVSAEELQTIQLFSSNTSSVVNITNIVNARRPYSTNIFEIPLGQGSGFIWDSDGHIVTNYHVVRGSASLRVTLIDQRTFPAKVIGADPSRDVAVLKLEAPPDVIQQLRPVELGDKDPLFVGLKVFAIGNPFGLDHSLSSGIISGLNRELAEEGGVRIKNAIQSDCSINPGNSGGPLLNSKGHVIAINTAIVDPTGKGGFNGIGFAVPISDAKGIVDQILKYGRVIRPAIGVTLAPAYTLRQLGFEDGVLVLDVPEGSPAYSAGLVGISKDSYGRLTLGDIIVAVEGKPVKNQSDLLDILDTLRVGQKIQIDTLRGGNEKKTFHVTLKERMNAVRQSS
jgi:S1-C subfamily serine protease